MAATSPDHKFATLTVGDFTVTGYAVLYEVVDVRDARSERRGSFETDEVVMTNLPVAAQLRFADGTPIHVVLVSSSSNVAGIKEGSRFLLAGAENLRVDDGRDDT